MTSMQGVLSVIVASMVICRSAGRRGRTAIAAAESADDPGEMACGP
jgi:hypothetical protein